nr:unnamed protein product [Spirometra erinaceieuropaei]
MDKHERAVRKMDQLSLVAEHCAAFGHAFAFQDAEVLGQGRDQTVRETLEAWHTTTTSINRCVDLPAVYQAQGMRRQSKDGSSQNQTKREHGRVWTSIGNRRKQAATGGERKLRRPPTWSEREHSARTNDNDRDPQSDVSPGVTTTVHTVTGRCERCRKAIYVEGGQRTMQTRAMAAVTPTPPPSPHTTIDEEGPMPP